MSLYIILRIISSCSFKFISQKKVLFEILALHKIERRNNLNFLYSIFETSNIFTPFELIILLISFLSSLKLLSKRVLAAYLSFFPNILLSQSAHKIFDSKIPV